MSDKGSCARLGTAVVALVSALGMSACSSGASGTGGAGATPASSAELSTPLATSIETADGTWATVPMGNLREPDNTFWQLFFRPTGSDTWEDEVVATATATNGGLVVADSPGGQLAVGVRPSQYLHFTPIVSSDDGGKTWSNGLLDGALGSNPSALALSPDGDALAVESSGAHAASVLVDTGGFSSWRPLLTLPALDAAPAGRACSPESFTAVAYAGSDPLLGVRCSRPGAEAIFVSRSGRWRAVGPTKPSQAERAGAQVLGFISGARGVTGLVGYSGRDAGALVASWTGDGETWKASQPLTIAPSDRILSYGGNGGNGVFVLLGVPDGGEQLEAVAGPGSRWTALPAPPTSTETVAMGEGGALTALAVSATVLTIWTLDPSDHWLMGQRLPVAIQFGSSS